MSQQQWYYAEGQARVGPVTREQLGRMARTGDLSRGQLVWGEGMADWAPAATIPGLFDGIAEPVVPLAYAKAPDHKTSRIVRNAKRNTVTLFVVFVLCLLPVVISVLFALARHRTVARGISVEVTAFGCSHFVWTAGIFAAIYLPVRWRYISQLPSPFKTLGLIGGIGLVTLFLLQLGWLVVALVL